MQIVGYKEYIDQIADEFPAVDKRSIATIVRHGLTMLAYSRANNHDIFLNHNLENFYFYFGDIATTIEKKIELRDRKLRKKLRYVYSLKKPEYSGYYYFGVSDTMYEEYLEKGSISKVILFKIQEECKLFKPATRFYKVKRETSERWSVLEENYQLNEVGAELLSTKSKLKYEEDSN